MFAALVARLWYLQVVQEAEFQQQAEANLIRPVQIPAPRGRILDVNDNVLVGNRITNQVEIDRFVLAESVPGSVARAELFERLAREITSTGRPTKAQAIQDEWDNPKYGPFDRIPIASDVTEEFVILLGERLDEFPGVSVELTTVRDYPYGDAAAHLLGYVGSINSAELEARENSAKSYIPNDEVGKTGVELAFEDVLRGTPGRRKIQVDAAGNVIRELESVDPVPGNDVRLTIDINLQVLAEKELLSGLERVRQTQDESVKDRVVNFKAPAGAVVLLDPSGSQILAAASYPTFDPSLFVGEISPEKYAALVDPAAGNPLFDRATQAEYSPGSTFKIITSYAAIDSGLLGERGFLGVEKFLIDDGVFRLPDCDFGPGCTIENAGRKPLGDVNLESSILESSNVYFGQLGYQFNVRQGFSTQQLAEVARDFGFGGVVDALPQARSGNVPPPSTAGESANVAIGQGALTASPLQLANAYGAIANGGSVYAPIIASASIDPITDEVLIDYTPRLQNELYFPPGTREIILRGMEGVAASEDGTAYSAFEFFPLQRWRLAGKTGTIEVVGKQDSAAFAAFGPMPNPEYVAVAYLEEAGLGGDAAAPIVANIFERIANDDIDIVPTLEEVEEVLVNFDAGTDVDLEEIDVEELATGAQDEPVVPESGAAQPDAGALPPDPDGEDGEDGATQETGG